MAVHVMARETQLMAIVESCESTWGLPVPKLYYHVDRIVAAESFPISRGRWGISANLAADASPGEFPRWHGEPSLLNRSAAAAAASRPRHRVAALILPERPSTQGEHWTISHDKGMTWNTWLRFKMRAIFDYSVRAHWAEIRETEWFVYVDDDTYVLWEPLLELLRRYGVDIPGGWKAWKLGRFRVARRVCGFLLPSPSALAWRDGALQPNRTSRIRLPYGN